jgi:signal transduction histidine kinase
MRKCLKRGLYLFSKFRSNSINQINVIAILFAGIFAFASAFIIIFNEYREFEKEVLTIEKEYIQAQKRVAVQQASRLYRLINYRYEEYIEKPPLTLYHLIAKEIEIVLDDMHDGSYLFVFDANKKTVYESKYVNLTKKIREEIVAQNSEGFYNFKTLKEGREIDNISFIREYKKLGWTVGSGVDLEEIERVLEKKRQEHRNKVTGFILKIITLTIFLYLASIIKYRYITERISKEVTFIIYSFKKASSDYRFIDRSKINLNEFREITSHANSMIAKIKEKNSALEDLNENLENLVQEKTQELQKSVAYNKQLLEDQDKFLKNAIHELNTPLSIILMNIDLYNLKYNKSPYLMKIEAAVKVLQNIYGDLSFIVKKDRVNYTKEMIDFSHFVKERVAYFSDVALGNKLVLVSEIEEGLFLFFNEIELQRLCDNNISNAIKYSYINEVIHVRLYKQDSCIVFEVENIGDTIEFVDKLFDRYYREDEARGGFGLGLNIVKEICDTNEVKVAVSSKEQKTIFRYSFECK